MKYHNRIIEDGCMSLTVAVIAQAVKDYQAFTSKMNPRDKKGYLTYIYKNYKDAQRFLFHENLFNNIGYLEIFLSTYNLELNPNYIRKKARRSKLRGKLNGQ